MKLRLESHTVDTRSGVMAGFLVRTVGGHSLGFIWTAGGSWRWRTMSGEHYGERSTKGAATEVLVDIAKLPVGPNAPRDAAPRSAWRPARPGPRPAPAPAAAAPATPTATRRVVWEPEAPGLAGAVAAAFRRA